MNELRLKLIDECNKSGLTIEELMFVVKDVYRDVTDLYNKWVSQKNNAAAADEISEAAPANEGE